MNEMELRGEMVKRGYTAAKLAESIGIGEKAMSNKLTGKSDFKQSEIKKICSVLNLDNDQIIAIFLLRKCPKRHKSGNYGKEIKK